MEPRHVDALLVGGGVAAARCARSLRRGGFDGSILLVGEEDLPPYNRPPLSKELLRGEVPAELVLAEPESWYERRGVGLLLGTPVTSLDPGERLVELADGRRIGYGRCLLATGAAPRRPPIPGVARAMLLRTLGQAEAIRDRAVAGGRAVVIGGGFIGVEVAASLAARGVAVTVLEHGPLLWGGGLGEAVSSWGVERLTRAGVAVRFEARATGVEEEAVVVGDARLPADLVAVGVGVSPRVELAEAAGLEVDDGILVDERQATSADGVFAAGDVARPRGGVRVEHWHAAREGGERAALAMLGHQRPPRRAAWIFSEFAGVHLDVVGSPDGGDEFEVAPGLHAIIRGPTLRQVAILNGAVGVEPVRALVDRSGGVDELRALAAP